MTSGKAYSMKRVSFEENKSFNKKNGIQVSISGKTDTDICEYEIKNLKNRTHYDIIIRAVNNNVLKRESDTIPDTDTSVIAGPRANVTALNFTVKSLTNDDYERYGKTGQTVSGATGTYKIIDTSVRILSTNGGSYDLPIRIIKKE